MSDVEAKSTANRRPRKRSPSYPSVDLERALTRTMQLWDKEKQYPTPIDSIVKLWGYANLNGPAGLTIAALKKYGLLSDEGVKADRRVQVTDLALDILNHPNSDTRRARIKVAALKPDAHQELWEKYGTQLPSDKNIIWELTREGGFSDTGAKELVRVYRQTVEFAGLFHETSAPSESESNAGPDQIDTETNWSEEVVTPNAPAPEQVLSPPAPLRGPRDDKRRSVSIPLPGGDEVTFQGQFPLTEAKWVYVMAVLNAMKPGLVDASPSDE